MKNFAKDAFSIAGLAFGGFGMVWGGLGLLTGGWQAGDYDFRILGAAITTISTAAFYAGYKKIKGADTGSNEPKKPDGPS